MKISDSMYVYTNKDGRVRAIIRNEDGSITSKSYPRILMEESLGRPLEPYEDVHYGRQEQLRRDSKAECGLNGESSPNGNAVPN